ncbi:MAG: iron-containing redox enzyme family protein [Candidatus Binatia bacterium]
MNAILPGGNSENSSYIDHTFSNYGADDRPSEADYNAAEKIFTELLNTASLDDKVRHPSPALRAFESGLEEALATVYQGGAGDVGRASTHEKAHLFLQRVLYRINRLTLFWFDSLSNYDNERSVYLNKIRNRIESAWQAWELGLLNIPAVRREDPCEGLVRRSACDLSPNASASQSFFRHDMNLAGYRRLLGIASLDGLVEASQLSRTLGGVSNQIHSMMTRLLVEEYGGGRLHRKHSTFFSAMLEELNMSTKPEAYFKLVPWQVLAGINHSFLLSDRKRFYLRYVGGLLYTEISVPAGFDNYRAAAERLGLSEAARGYWELHIKEDQRHGKWMLHDVALPLAAKYPAEAWEMVLGYDQQKFFSERSAAAIERSVRSAEYEAERDTIGCQSAA